MKIDWLEGTILDASPKSVLWDLKTLFSDWQELEHGGLGYEYSAIVLESGRVFWSESRPQNGIHVSLPPSALENSDQDYLFFARTFKRWVAKFTRLDIAEDDTKGILDLTLVCNSIELGNFVSSAKKKPMQMIDYESAGRTFYVGRGQSKTRIRIYDKAAEQNASGKKYFGHWVRVEMQLRDERATNAVNYILDHADTWQKEACGWLLSALDFKIPGTDSNKSRWQTTDWWLHFLDHAAKARIFMSRKVHTIESVVNWVGHQVSPSLLVLQTAYGKEALSDIAQSASARLKPKHLAMIKSAGVRVPGSKSKQHEVDIKGDLE